jgi:hypothetical protein
MSPVAPTCLTNCSGLGRSRAASAAAQRWILEHRPRAAARFALGGPGSASATGNSEVGQSVAAGARPQARPDCAVPVIAYAPALTTEGCVQQPLQRGPGRRRQRKTVAHRDDAATAITVAPGGGDGTEHGAGMADRRTTGCVERGEPQPVARPANRAHQLEQARRKQGTRDSKYRLRAGRGLTVQFPAPPCPPAEVCRPRTLGERGVRCGQ